MKTIPVGSKLFAIVDDDDFKLICNYRWQFERGYAKAQVYMGRGEKWQSEKYQYKYQHVYMHRLISNAQRGQVVDHANGNRLDNRKCNLRLCSSSENAKNVKGKSRKYSKYKGVTKIKNSDKWQAQITVNYKSVYLGLFAGELEAAQAYNIAALKHFGEFAQLNILESQP